MKFSLFEGGEKKNLSFKGKTITECTAIAASLGLSQSEY